MFKVVIKPLAFALVCFFAGYQFAVFTKPPAPMDTARIQLAQEIAPTNNYHAQNRFELEDADVVKDGPLTTPKNISANETPQKSANNDFSKKLIYDDVEGMLASLDVLRAEPGNAQLVATQYDVLKNFLIEHPESLDEIITRLDSHSASGASFDTILSLAQALPSENTERSLHLLAQQYAGAFDQDSQGKFIAVLSNSSKSIESEHILQSLVDLVVFGQTDVNTKLGALNLVKPHQLRESEKSNIRRELSQLVNNVGDQEAVRLLPDLLRFSKKEQRTEIASNLLSQNRSGSIRSAVLDGISSGSIPASDDMKAVLLEMANNPNEVLRHEAFEALEYSFELSQQEYAQLKSYR